MVTPIERHSNLIDPSEKHLPKGMENPTKGSLLVGDGVETIKLETNSNDGSLLTSKSSNSGGLGWISTLLARSVSNGVEIFFRHPISSVQIFRIVSNYITAMVKLETGNLTDDETISVNVRGNDNVLFKSFFSKFLKPLVLLKDKSTDDEAGTSGEAILDMYGKKRLTAIDGTYGNYSLKSGFIEELMYSNRGDYSSYVPIAEIEMDPGSVAGAWYAGFIEFYVGQVNNGVNESGFARRLYDFSVINGVISTHLENSNTNSNYPRTTVSAVGGKITISVSVTTGGGADSIIYFNIKYGVSTGIGDRKFNLRLL